MQFGYDENGVCTKRILSSFKETQSTDNYGSYFDYGPVAETLDEFKEIIRESIQEFYCDMGFDESCFLLSNQAVVEATTSHRQPIAERFLKEIGFQQVGPFSSEKYPSSRVSVWLMGAKEFCEAVGWDDSEYQARLEEDYD